MQQTVSYRSPNHHVGAKLRLFDYEFQSAPARLSELAGQAEALGASGNPFVLMAGFKPTSKMHVSRPFFVEGWNVYIAQSSYELNSVVREYDFKLVLLDVENIDDYAPFVIDRLRKRECTGKRSHVVGLSKYYKSSFANLLMKSGADELLSLS